MKKMYEWVLFDADDTLFCFNAFCGLQLMFSDLNITFTLQDYEEYQAVNKSLWASYQQGIIKVEQVKNDRFSVWADRLQIASSKLNNAFMDKMSEICTPMEGTIDLLNALKGKFKLGIITNGFTQLQQTRLDRTGLSHHFELLVISEEVGFAKPHMAIFDHALSSMGNPLREQVLMVGDNPETDIIGGLNAGLDTCWLNVDNKQTPNGINPHYQISSLAELSELLLL